MIAIWRYTLPGPILRLVARDLCPVFLLIGLTCNRSRTCSPEGENCFSMFMSFKIVGRESSQSTQNRVYSSYRPKGKVFSDHRLDTPHDTGLLSIQILFAKALSGLLWADAASLGSRDVAISH